MIDVHEAKRILDRVLIAPLLARMCQEVWRVDPVFRDGKIVDFTRRDPAAFKSVPVARDEVPCATCGGVEREWPTCRLECCPHRTAG